MHRPRSSRLAALLLLLGAVQAQAGRPFITEDAGLLASGDCEWETVAARSRIPQATPPGRSSSLGTQIGCGLGRGMQLALQAASERTDGERSRSLGVAGKLGLLDGGDDGPNLTLAWGSSWTRGAGAGTSWDGLSALLVYSMSLPGGSSLHANLGRQYSRPDRRSTTLWAAAVETPLGQDLDIGAELFGVGSQRPGVGIGLRWRPADRWTLDASLARSGGTPRERLITLGFKREF